MTIKHRQAQKCERCGLISDTDTPFGRWLRAQDELASTFDSGIEGVVAFDMDWIIHRYRKSRDRSGEREIEYLMVLETKSFDARVPQAQRDTMNIIGQLLNNSRNNNFVQARGVVRKVFSVAKNSPVRVRCFGVHALVFQRTSPADSTYMKWDGKQIDAQALVKLLRFDLNPYTLMPLDDRRHHQPTLFSENSQE